MILIDRVGHAPSKWTQVLLETSLFTDDWQNKSGGKEKVKPLPLFHFDLSLDISFVINLMMSLEMWSCWTVHVGHSSQVMPGQRTVNAVVVCYENVSWGSFSSKESLKSSGEHPPKALKAWHKSFYPKNHFLCVCECSPSIRLVCEVKCVTASGL